MKKGPIVFGIAISLLLGFVLGVVSRFTPHEGLAMAENTLLHQKTLMAERFILVNQEGAPRAVLGQDHNNSFALTIFDGKANPRIVLSVLESGPSSIAFKDEKQQDRMRLAFDEEGRIALDFKDAERHRLATLYLTALGVPSLTLIGKNGVAQAGMGATVDGEAFLTASTNQGEGVDLYFGTRVAHETNGGMRISTSAGSTSVIVSGDGSSAFLQQRNAIGSIGIYTVEEGPVVSLFDDRRTARASLDINQGDARLRFFGKDGKNRLGVGSLFNDEAMLVFHGHDHSLAGIIRPNGKGKLVASDDHGIETLLTAKQ